MAVLGRLLVSSAERLDLPDFLSIDSYTQGDFKYLLRSFVGGEKPYILTGFDVINPEASIGTQNISVRVADSVVYYPGSLAGPFFHGLEEGNLQAAPLVPELRKNSTNYVYLTLTTTEAAKDTRAFWDPDKEGGEGGEFTQDVNTQTVLSVDVNVSVSSFPENTVPVCKVIVGANFIDSIEDARDMMFRLGSGGLNPNPLSRYDWRGEPTDIYKRAEPNTVMTSALDPNPFEGGDKNIESLKEWMDAVMTKLAELGGTTYWYEDTSVFNIISVFKDALTTSIKSKGYWNSSDVSPGVLTWSEDIVIQSTSDLSEVIVRSGSETLQDNEVLYLNRVREAAINSGGIAVEFFNGVDHINGQLGSFENLSKGDWIKKADDPDNFYRRVEEFYAADNKGGGVTAPAAALSVKLSAGYPGISEMKQASYLKGVYLSTEVDVASRDAQDIQDIAGNFYWLAMRSDTILNIDDITATQLTCDITGHDGVRATVTSTNHGLQDGQRVTISGSTNFDGSYAVSVEDLDTFYISVAGGPHADELAQSAFYATVTTAARSTDNGLQLESANHGLETDQRVIISDTTNFNGDYQVFPLTDTTFTVAVPSLIAAESAGTSTSVNIYVRTDVGPTRLERGENKSIGEVDGDNLMAFIGMDNDAQTHPNYYIAPSYNTLYDKQNFNTDTTDNLTQRVSKLTAMMADKAQDKAIVQSATGVTSFSNVASGPDQVISFVPGGTFSAIQPGSPGNMSLTLGGTLALAENQVATYTIDRNSSTVLADLSELTIYDIQDCPIEENLFVFAYRFTGTNVYLWDGLVVGGGITPVETPYIQKVNYIDLVTTTLPVTASVTVDDQSLVNGDTVLFAELSVDPGVYIVSGIGVAAEWTKVACFQGGTDPLEGSNVNVIGGTSYFDSTWRFDGSRWKPLDGDVVAKARTGFPDESKEGTTIAFDDGTRTFSITPTGTHFDIYQSGVPYRFEGTQQIVIPDIEGFHFIYFDEGTLTVTQAFDFDIILEWVYVANVYWDATNSKAVLVGDERHGLGMDAKTHEYLHNINGTQINNGFALGNFTTTGDGSANADAQISISNGVIRDEDITHSVQHAAVPSAAFEQVLDPIAQLPIWYREGASGFWREDAATNAPVSVGATIHYNEFTGAVWQKTEAGDGKFVAMWIFATNDIYGPMISMMGQNVWDTLGEAQDGEQYNAISFGTLPAQEFKVAYRLIFETSSSYTNSYKARLADVRDLRQTIDPAAPAYAGSYHGSLSGLTDQHHPDFSIFVEDPSQFSGAMTSADDDVQKALQSIDPWFRQLRIKEHPTNKKRVTISAADALRTEGTTLSQVVKNLLLKFDGAEIDFATGNIYESDGMTSLGIDFTPETIPVGEWQWYSVTLIPSTVNADNTINGQLIVLAGSASGATKELAVKAPFANGTQLGLVAVQASNPGPGIEDIPQSDIRQLGVGGGSGGGTGDANELLERVKNRLDLAEYDAVTPVIFSSVEEDLTDEPNTTASYDVANARYNFEFIDEVFTSTQMVDDQFLSEEKDIADVELVAYWDLDKIDTAAVYEVSRDGGNEYQTVLLDRIGNSDTYHGRHVFTEEATFTEVIENTAHNTDLEMTDTIIARAQAFTVTNSMTIKSLTVGVSVVGTIQGSVSLKVVRDNATVPSTDPADILFESVPQYLDGLSVGDNDIQVDCTIPVNAGTYHLVIESDLEYRDNFLTGVNALSVRANSADTSPDSSALAAGTWVASGVGKLEYEVAGRVHDLRVRITGKTDDVDLNGLAVFYDRDDSFSLISEGYERQVFIISGDDNIDSFDITNFVPDPILMNVHEIETGQTHRAGAWTLNGTRVEFPTNTFDKPGETITLEFLQMFKGTMQFDSRNRAILAENGLGSQDASLDLSQPGKGILLRRPDGTMREIALDDDDNIVIKSVP